MFITFRDLEKAFDMVPRVKLWKVINMYNVPSDPKQAIVSTYIQPVRVKELERANGFISSQE